MTDLELDERARIWVESQTRSSIAAVTEMGGGITNTKWKVRLSRGDPVVIRWSDPAVWAEKGRDHVQREAAACRLLATSDVLLPRLIATDGYGDVAGAPANLMTWQPGSPRLDPLGTTAVHELARLAVAIHRHPVPVQDRAPTFSYRCPASPEVPDWARRPALWRRAIDIWKAGAPPTPYGLLHRDFHLGNILWDGDQVTGVVDWAEMSWGPADLDVAHICADFAMLHTLADADAFRTSYQALGGVLDRDLDGNRFWIVSDILGFLPDPAHILPGLAGARPDVRPDDVRFGLEELLERTLS
ncbi:phosphotransferase family protein [Microlunatus elymi]|nr:aminoglycoside phosphotransferase family protein [Microlunatus elymi]